MKCEVLGLDESFQGIYFSHPFFKACQCTGTKEKFAKSQICFNQVYIVKFAKIYNLA
jgi:hypothetical protein